MEVLKRVRQQVGSRIPVLFSTARTDEADVVLALRQGADGYLVKPLRRLELLARVEAVTRRNVPKVHRLSISKSAYSEWMLRPEGCSETMSR